MKIQLYVAVLFKAETTDKVTIIIGLMTVLLYGLSDSSTIELQSQQDVCIRLIFLVKNLV